MSIPEWLHDRGLPWPLHAPHQVCLAFSIPCVVGPYGSVNCTLSLQASSVRVSPLLANGVYGRDPTQDDIRFIDYFGATDLVVTSGRFNDFGMFETNLHDERFLWFEGAGAISTWTLTLPGDLRAFDYSNDSHVIIHVRYTARQAGDPLGSQAIKELKNAFDDKNQSPQTLLLCLKYDFPTEWAAFVNGGGQTAFQAAIDSSFLPYYVRGMKKLTVNEVRMFYQKTDGSIGTDSAPVILAGSLISPAGATLSLPGTSSAMMPNLANQVYVLIAYTSGDK